MNIIKHDNLYPYMTAIGTRISEHQSNLGYSNAQMAECMGTSAQIYYRIISGSRQISLQGILNLALNTGADLNYILTGETSTHSEVLRGITSLPQEQRFDIYNRLYNFFSGADTSALDINHRTYCNAPPAKEGDFAYFKWAESDENDASNEDDLK